MKNKSEVFYDSKVVFHQKNKNKLSFRWCFMPELHPGTLREGVDVRDDVPEANWGKCGGDGMVTSFSGYLIENRFLLLCGSGPTMYFYLVALKFQWVASQITGDKEFGNSTSSIAHLVWLAICSTKHVDLS